MVIHSCEDLYNNPDLYDATYVGLTNEHSDDSFYQSLIKKDQNILYLGSGSGRLLKKLVTINPNIIGVELAQPMIDNCKKILPNAKVIHANVLDLNLDQKFDLIIAPYRFISHFDKSGLGKLFQVVAKHLISGGK